MGGGADGPAVEVRDLVKTFGGFTALSGLTFAVRRGEVFGLLGPNGSGKTTTVNLISGLNAPTEGRVSVFGLDPRGQAAAVRRLLGVVPQETALYEELTAERNLSFHAELFGIPSQRRGARIAEMLRLAQLSDRARSRVGTFSGGMKRRLAIARALLHDPALIYLDEPTLGVDVQARHAVWDYIRAMRAEGRTVLLTTNYLEEGDALCDRMAIIDRGRMVALDTPAALKARYGSSVLDVELDGEPPPALVASVEALPGVVAVQAAGARVRVRVGGGAGEPGGPRGSAASAAPDAAGGAEARGGRPGADGAGGQAGPVHDEAPGAAAPAALLPAVLAAASAAGLGVRHLNLREPSLDEVFLALTGRGLRD